MRRTEESTVFAFLRGDKARAGNSATDGTEYRLHDNLIATSETDGVGLSDAGWSTVTTASRLRAIVSALGRADVRVQKTGDSIVLRKASRWENARPVAWTLEVLEADRLFFVAEDPCHDADFTFLAR